MTRIVGDKGGREIRQANQPIVDGVVDGGAGGGGGGGAYIW